MAPTSSSGLLIIAGWLATASPAAAQSPRAGGPAPGDDPSSRIAAELAAAGNIARGFVDRELISTRGILQGWDGPWGLYIQPYWLYGRVGTPMGKLTTDNEIYVRTGLFAPSATPCTRMRSTPTTAASAARSIIATCSAPAPGST